MTELNKLNLKTPDLCSENFNKFEQLFPNCVTETQDDSGNVVKTINFDLLKQIVGIENAGGGREFYEFSWPGKRASIIEANAPITKTLRPCVEDSKDWQNTKNLYIEGDNLEALKILQESYLGKVKMIYIDPPYNTGNDFVYKDDFSQSEANYSDSVGQKNECGEKLFKNTESNGRFHSDWCSMIYPRLLLARNLLSEDGVIFISIDDHEQDNLKKICDSVFGENNFVATLNWRRQGGRQDSKYYAVVHEYVHCYAKSIDDFSSGVATKSEDIYPKYDQLNNSYYKTQLLRKWGSNSLRENRPNLFYPIKGPNSQDVYPMIYRQDGSEIQGCWRWGKSHMERAINDGLVEFKLDNNNKLIAYEKIYAPKNGDKKTKKYSTWIDDTGNGTKNLKSLFSEGVVFDYSKSPEFIERFLKMANVDLDDIILDFFSGSATTAHAVMQLNAEDGGNRQFIMVQIPEKCDEKTEAFKAGYKNICEIGKERIRRAGEQIKKDLPDSKVDIGFRVFKVDSSNMKDVYYNPEKLKQDLLSSLESNVKEDRTDYDLLFSTILDLGLTLDKEVKEETIDNTKVYIYNDDEKEGPDLIACFAENITEDVITAIAKRNPLKAVFKDSSFENSPSKINLFELFKTYANISDDSELQSRVRVI